MVATDCQPMTAPRFCISCGTGLDPEARFCPSCGTAVVIADEPPAAAYCSNCGDQLQPGSQFCTSCGTPVAADQAQEAEPVSGARRDELSPPENAKISLPLPPIGLAFAAGIALVVVVAVVLSGGGDDEGSGAPFAAATEPAAAAVVPTEVPPAIEATETAGPEPTPGIDPAAQGLLDEVVASLEGDVVGLGLSDAPDTVTSARFGNGALELELRTRWASQDRQAETSFKVIGSLATTLGGYSEAELSAFAGGASFEVVITTYSVDGQYRYQSLTDYATLSALADGQIDNAGWAAAASAGFREN